MQSRIAWRWSRLRRRRERRRPAAQPQHTERMYCEAQRRTALAAVRAGVLDEEAAAYARVSLARLDCWFAADPDFWCARRTFEAEVLEMIREAAQHEPEAWRWLDERGVPLWRGHDAG